MQSIFVGYNEKGEVWFSKKESYELDMNDKNVMSTSANDDFDETKVEKLTPLDLLKKIGPGIILTGIVIGPGAITTASMIGAKYGYSLVWLYILIAFMGTTYVLATYRLSMLTGMPTIHAIKHYYGKTAAGFKLFLTCCFFTIGNISGTGAGNNAIRRTRDYFITERNCIDEN